MYQKPKCDEDALSWDHFNFAAVGFTSTAVYKLYTHLEPKGHSPYHWSHLVISCLNNDSWLEPSCNDVKDRAWTGVMILVSTTQLTLPPLMMMDCCREELAMKIGLTEARIQVSSSLHCNQTIINGQLMRPLMWALIRWLWQARCPQEVATGVVPYIYIMLSSLLHFRLWNFTGVLKLYILY